MSTDDSPVADREAAFAKERRDLDARQAAVRAADNARQREARLAQLEQEKRERVETRRTAAEAELKAHLRLQYLKSPMASEADFEAAYPGLRTDFLLREAREAPLREKAALARNPEYRM